MQQVTEQTPKGKSKYLLYEFAVDLFDRRECSAGAYIVVSDQAKRSRSDEDAVKSYKRGGVVGK